MTWLSRVTGSHNVGKVFSIITAGTRGVDGSSDPLSLRGKLRHAINLQFQSGRIMTRPVFEYQKLGLRGQFQGAALFNPSLGISFRPFAPCGTRLATAVSGRIFVNNAPDTGVVCAPMELKNPDQPTLCGQEVDDLCTGDINIYQAENILVIQALRRNTMWWTGEGDLVVSPGMVADADQLADHSHDSFIDEKHKNFLINGAGVGVFWNGRVHQQGRYGVFVGDQIHKRGDQGTSDIVLMEEQALQDSISTNSRLGALLAIQGVPQMGTSNGEGQLVGYYEGGIVEYNTFQFPRLSDFTAKGERITAGWDTKQMVKHNCNVVSAVGRYAVGVLPRNHFFRSGFGIHILSEVLGVEYIKDEPINIISDEVSNILGEDDSVLLHGAAAGCWHNGHRWFMTTGFTQSKVHSSSPMGKGFVSWNKLWARTEDNTPVPVWEGAWIVDDGVAGIHWFSHTGMREDRGCYGFLSSDIDKNLWFAALRQDGDCDLRAGQRHPVCWALETGRYDFGDTTRTKTLKDGRFEGIFRHKGTKVTVYVRSNVIPLWQRWLAFDTCEKDLEPGQRLSVSKPLGCPPVGVEEATWLEFRVEGTGAAEIVAFEVEISEGSDKVDGTYCHTITDCVPTNPLTVAL